MSETVQNEVGADQVEVEVEVEGSSASCEDGGGNENEENDREQNLDENYGQNIDMERITPAKVKQLQFYSSDGAYFFYNEYGRVNGFGIRRSKIGRNKRNEVIWVKFVCNREGAREVKYLTMGKRKRGPRPLSRCGCVAHLQARLNLSTGMWIVGDFCDDHNHTLIGKKCTGLARSHRKMCDADIAQLNAMRKSGISTPLIYGSFAIQSGGIRNLRFGPRNVYNQIVKERQMLDSDFNEALKYFGDMESLDSGLFWKYSIGEDDSFLHFFWCDGASRLDYELFGDVLAFDATYGKNKYRLPVVIFSGVNHHMQTCVFATAIVSNETNETYVWVLEQFLLAMKGKCPTTVITDGDLAMRNAISTVFPEAHHRLCAWHLLRNATSNVHKPYFTKKLKKCMLGDCEVLQFEARWKKLVEECGLQENAWVADLYSKKMMWASAHIRGKFFAGLRTTSRCEGLHAMIGRYVKKGYTLVEFLEQYDRCLEKIRNNEIEADYKSQNFDPILQTEYEPLERFAAKIYTMEVFEVFRIALVKSGRIVLVELIESPSSLIYIMAKYRTPNMKWYVSFYPQQEEFRCSCRRMESNGIPCSHILSVMIHLHMEQLPRCLILDRWTKNIKEGLEEKFGHGGARVDATYNVLKLGALVHSCREMARLACFSNDDFAQIKEYVEKQKRRLKAKFGHRVVQSETQRRTKSDVPGKQIGATVACSSSSRKKGQGQRCSVCRREGHNRSTCPYWQQVQTEASHEAEHNYSRNEDDVDPIGTDNDEEHVNLGDDDHSDA